VLLLWRWESAAERAERAAAQPEPDEVSDGAQPARSAPFPTPPLDLPHYHGVGLAGTGKPVLAGVTGDDGTKEVSGA